MAGRNAFPAREVIHFQGQAVMTPDMPSAAAVGSISFSELARGLVQDGPPVSGLLAAAFVLVVVSAWIARKQHERAGKCS